MSDMHPDRFLDDVLGAPASLRALAAAYPQGPGVDIEGRRVVFLGMGSSRFAALTVAAGLRARGVDAHAEMASTGAPQPPSTDTAAIAISATRRLRGNARGGARTCRYEHDNRYYQ